MWEAKLDEIRLWISEYLYFRRRSADPDVGRRRISIWRPPGGAVINAVLSGAELVYIASDRADLWVFCLCSVRREGYAELERQSGRRDDQGRVYRSRHDRRVTAISFRSGQDVKILYLGGVREALAALDRGIVAASTISAPTTLMARRMGIRSWSTSQRSKFPTYKSAW